MWQKLEKRIWNNKISKAYVLSLITYREKLTEREIHSLKNAEMLIKTREILCSWSHGVSTGNNEFKLKQKRFWLYLMNNFPTAVIKKWQNTLPREAAESTFSEFFSWRKRQVFVVSLFLYRESLSSPAARRWTRSLSGYSSPHKLCRARSRLKRWYPATAQAASGVLNSSATSRALSWGPELQSLSPAAPVDKAITFRGKTIQPHHRTGPQGQSTGRGPVACIDIA